MDFKTLAASATVSLVLVTASTMYLAYKIENVGNVTPASRTFANGFQTLHSCEQALQVLQAIPQQPQEQQARSVAETNPAGNYIVPNITSTLRLPPPPPTPFSSKNRSQADSALDMPVPLPLK